MQEEEYSSPRSRKRKAKSLHQGKEFPMSLGISTKQLEETEQEHEENENESSIDVQNKDTSEMKRIPEITIEELQTAINRLKKAILQTAMESEPKTSKLATKKRNEIVKQNEFTPEAWRKVRIKVIHKKRRLGRFWKLQPELLFACVVRQYCTADYTPDLTKSKRKIRPGSEALTKQQTIWRHTE